MLAILKKWDSMPPVVKKAIICLLAGWAAHYIFYFGFIAEDQPERVTYLNLGVGIAICYCVATIRKWARKLCIFFNIVMVPMYLLFAIAFAQGGKIELFRPHSVYRGGVCFFALFSARERNRSIFLPAGKRGGKRNR